MNRFSVGIMADSFRLPLREGIARAASLGADAVQLYAVGGELPPEIPQKDLRDLGDYIASRGLVVSALCGDLGGHGFEIAEDNPRKVDISKRILENALTLGCHAVTTHIGVVPAEECAKKEVMRKACRELAEFADTCGARFAIETGPETAVTLRGFLDSLGASGVGVNLDPANLVMVTGDDPIAATRTLGPYIAHTHAKDGVMLQKSDPVKVYGFFAEGGIGDLRLEDYFRETPLGEGGVDFTAWLAALAEIGYAGPLTIEREVGADPARDIAMAVSFLREKMKPYEK